MAAGKPPTSNLLYGDERRRVMRSARKIGALTGTTPLLVDELRLLPAMEIILPALARRSSKREGMILTSSTSSLESELGKKAESFVEHRPVAKLSLSPDARNSISDATRLRLVLTLTQRPPEASSSDDPDSVLKQSLSLLISATPSDPESLHAARRKKMVKLVNVLGGPIPSALVFPPKCTRDPSKRHTRRRSRSLPPPSAYSPPTGPNKLVRRPSVELEHPLPALTVDLISRPRPLIPLGPPLCPAPRGRHGELRPRNSVVSSLSKGSTRAYSLRRRGRESSSHNTSES
ncbi:hypothetical protein C8F01DRAFT_307735 [Mycena amicta]|nr:hypothetical protein C8F01DRAFT_307735 [Mycena amicta]